MNTSFPKYLFIFFCFFITATGNVFAGITVNFTIKSLVNNHFSFIASSTSSSLPVNYYWDFGDGTTQAWDTGIIANHTFQASGTYSVKLVGENSIGERDSVVKNVVARRNYTSLNADFSFSPGIIHLADTVRFSNTTTSTNGTAQARWWSFGDGQYNSNEENPVVIYRAPGLYKVTFTASNQAFETDTTIKYINVLPPAQSIKADFIFSPSPIYTGTQTQFTSIAYTASGTITGWKWKFANDTAAITLQNPVYTFSDTGTFSVKFSIGNSIGETDSITRQVTVLALQQETKYSCPNATTDLYAAYAAATYRWQESTDSGNTYHNLTNNSNFWEVTRFHLMVINPPTAWYGYKYRCVTNVGIGTEYKLEFQNSHISGSGAWEAAATWSCGIVPDGNTDVVISGGTVTVGSNVTCRSLTVLPGAEVIVSPGFNITVLH